MEKDCILIRQGEISLKGKNREDFERKLLKNILLAVKRADDNIKVSKIYSGFVVENYFPESESKMVYAVQKVFGISNFCIAKKVDNDLDEIKKAALELAKKANPKTFKISTKRSNKNFKYTSMDLNRLVGEVVFETLNIAVQVTKPELTIYIDVSEKFTFVYGNKLPALGGLPVGCSGEVISMISGGIDSPVSSFLVNKRGCHITYITFESYPFTSKQSVEKVKELVEILSGYQTNTALYIVPFAEIQKEIKAKCSEKNRTILYRRMMVRIANKLAENILINDKNKSEKISAEAIVTGEAIGQVASQTLTNISCVEESSRLPIIRPLICFDKQEIINLAQKIGTYDISIKPHQDCCTVFQPENPATHARMSDILEDEGKLDVDNLIKSAIDKWEIVKF
jgi:tRNA uracil 4-sulfurtransferase